MRAVNLKCGMTAVFVPCEAESVAFGIFVGSGSRHEPKKLAGISHFIEHMLFKGTKTRSAFDISRAIEGRGGNFNAYTSEDSTSFFAHLPNEYLEEAIDILSDMYRNSTYPEVELEREKGVVLEEINMYADDPDSVAEENLQRAIFPLNQLGAPISGSAQSVKAMTSSTLRRYMTSHYLPSTTTLVVAGAFDEEKAERLLNSAFGGGTRRKTPAFATEPVDFSIPPTAEVSSSKDIKQMRMALGFRAFGYTHPMRYAATVMDGILGRGMSSRLFQEVREKKGLAYDISSHTRFFSDAGYHMISCGLSTSNAKRALATVEREIEKICTKKVSRAELERTKEFMIGNFRLGQEKILSKMLFAGAMYRAYGKVVTPAEQVEAVKAVTAEDVQRVANEIFRPENRAISWVVPK